MDWYKKYIEKPVRSLVKLLRDNGFTTVCSCGHLPRPYIDMEWNKDIEVTKLYNLLIKNGYRNFIITARWDTVNKHTFNMTNVRLLHLMFYIKMPLANINRIKVKIRRNK